MANRINAKQRGQVNRELGKVLKSVYFEAIPLKDIDSALRKHDMMLLQEDGTPWSGIICGNEGQADFLVGPCTWNDALSTPYGNCVFHMSWYRMPSGRYEVIGYLS